MTNLKKIELMKHKYGLAQQSYNHHAHGDYITELLYSPHTNKIILTMNNNSFPIADSFAAISNRALKLSSI